MEAYADMRILHGSEHEKIKDVESKAQTENSRHCEPTRMYNKEVYSSIEVIKQINEQQALLLAKIPIQEAPCQEVDDSASKSTGTKDCISSACLETV